MNEFFTKAKTPLICVPLTGATQTELEEQLEKILPQAPDMLEWRADFFKDLANQQAVIKMIHYMKGKTDIPLLFTIRSENEGGEKVTLSESAKVELIHAVSERTAVDIIDYEVSNDSKFVQQLRDVSRKNGQQLILSYHNFVKTPDNNQLVALAKQMAAYDADVAKLAVMPSGRKDVYRLLEVTREIDDSLTIPVVTMAMGEVGALSRVIGWAYGSALTFGVGVASSAPGQIAVSELRQAIQAVQAVVPDWE